MTGETQESILLSLVQNAPGEVFVSNEHGWTSDVDACDWYGVYCNSLGDVTKISLTGYKLQATLPTEFAYLDSLQDLTLANCHLVGTIPSAISSLPLLETLDLSQNGLSGSIPQLASSFLKDVTLAKNEFTGTISNQFQNGRELVNLDCQENLLTGSMPSFAAKSFPRLSNLDLSHNVLTGTISNAVQLPLLERLFISSNFLTGTIPSNTSSSIIELRLQQNRLSGTLPSELALLSNLDVLMIQKNQLTGTIPSPLCMMNLNTNFVDSFSSRRSLEVDELVEACSAVACPVNFKSETGLGSNCTPCGSEEINPYLGATTCLNVTQDYILDVFATSNFRESVLGLHWASVQPCEREGVVCDNDGNVLRIQVSNLGLRGSLPFELGLLPRLVELDVSYNELTGKLPEELSLAPLELLILAENQITGYVPDALCQKKGVNRNGEDGIFRCDIIACGMASYHPAGHAVAGVSGESCSPCSLVDGMVLANTNCQGSIPSDTQSMLTRKGRLSDMTIVVITVGAALLFFVAGFWVLRRLGSAPQIAVQSVRSKSYTDWDTELVSVESLQHKSPQPVV